MGVISIPNTFSAGATIIASEHNENFSTISDAINGNLDNANIKSNAAIVDTKLAQISTAQKVKGSALTSFSDIPTAAGQIPSANLNTGTTANKILYLDGNARIPAVDGVNITTLNASSITTGLVPTAQLGSETASSTKFLRGDQTWQSVQPGLGNWLDLTAYFTGGAGTISATASGFTTCRAVSAGGTGAVYFYTDVNASPTTLLQEFTIPANGRASICGPVKAGHYWKYEIAGNISMDPVYFIPLTS